MAGCGSKRGLLPFLTAYLLTATLRERPSPWPFLFAPLLLMVWEKYAMDAFYPPYRDEFLALLVAGATHGAVAWVGSFLSSRSNRRDQSKSR